MTPRDFLSWGPPAAPFGAEGSGSADVDIGRLCRVFRGTRGSGWGAIAALRASYAADFPAAAIKGVLSNVRAVGAATFVGNHEGDGSMALRGMTVHRYEEIRRRLAEGRSLLEIARALGCSRRTVREVRDGERVSPDTPKSVADPLWMLELDWPTIIHDLGLGHPLKFLWEERAQHLTTYSNFWNSSTASSRSTEKRR